MSDDGRQVIFSLEENYQLHEHQDVMLMLGLHKTNEWDLQRLIPGEMLPFFPEEAVVRQQPPAHYPTATALYPHHSAAAMHGIGVPPLSPHYPLHSAMHPAGIAMPHHDTFNDISYRPHAYHPHPHSHLPPPHHPQAPLYPMSGAVSSSQPSAFYYSSAGLAPSPGASAAVPAAHSHPLALPSSLYPSSSLPTLSSRA
jgi:hypothetical protein